MGQDPLEKQWQTVMERWEEPEVHRRFLAQAELSHRLGDAGARYRQIRDNDPERAEIAQFQLNEILGRAIAGLRPSSAHSFAKTRARFTWLLGVLCAALLGLLLLRLWPLWRELPLRF